MVMIAAAGNGGEFSRPDWRPRAYRKPPPHIAGTVSAIEDDIHLVCTRVFPLSEIVRGDLRHLGVEWRDGELHIPTDHILPPDELGRHSRWNIHRREVVRKDLPKKRGTISWDGLAFGEHPTTFHRTDDFYQREWWHGHKYRFRIRLLRNETLNDTQILVISVELLDALQRGRTDFDRELLFRINLLQEAIGGSFALPPGYTDDDLLSLTFVGWKLLPPGLRTTDVFRVLGGVRSVEEKLALIERMEFIKQECPEAQIMAGAGGFNGYFLAKIRDDCVVAEHLTPGNAIYIFDQRWPELSRVSRQQLIHDHIPGFRRIEHRGDWKGTIAKVIQSARAPE